MWSKMRRNVLLPARDAGVALLLCGLLACAGSPAPRIPVAPKPAAAVLEAPSLAQLWLTVPDSTRQREAFLVRIQLADGRGAPLVGPQRVWLRASQAGVQLEEESVVVENGRASAQVRALSWSGPGLYLAARCQLGDGTRLVSASNSTVVLPAR